MVHTRGVVSILEVGKFLVSVCFGRQLIIWNGEDFSYRKGIDDIRCTSSDGMVGIGDGMVIVGGPDCVAVVNVISAQVVNRYGYSNCYTHNEPVYISFVELDNKDILVGTTSCEMYVIPKNLTGKIEIGDCVNTPTKYGFVKSMKKLNDGRIVAANDKFLTFWNINSNTNIK